MAGDDVEMKAAEEKKEEVEEKKTPPPPPPPQQEIKTNVALIEKGVQMLEPRFTHRVLRNLNGLRKKLDARVLREAIEGVYVKGMHAIRAHMQV